MRCCRTPHIGPHGSRLPWRLSKGVSPAVTDAEKLRVDCDDCAFSKVVPTDADVQPAEIVVEHGQERGHTLSIEPVEE